MSTLFFLPSFIISSLDCLLAILARIKSCASTNQEKEGTFPLLQSKAHPEALPPGGSECPGMPEGTRGGGVSVVRGENRQELAPPPPLEKLPIL